MSSSTTPPASETSIPRPNGTSDFAVSPKRALSPKVRPLSSKPITSSPAGSAIPSRLQPTGQHPRRLPYSPTGKPTPASDRTENLSLLSMLDDSAETRAATFMYALESSYNRCRAAVDSDEEHGTAQGGMSPHLNMALADVTNRFCSATQEVVAAADELTETADDSRSNSIVARCVVGMMLVMAIGFAIVAIVDIDNTARAAFAGAAVAASVVAFVLVVVMWVLGLEERWSAAKLASRAVNQILDDEVLVLRSRSRRNRAWIALERLVQDITKGKVDGRYVKSVILPAGERMSWDEVRLIGRMASTTRMRLREAETTFGGTIEWPQALPAPRKGQMEV